MRTESGMGDGVVECMENLVRGSVLAMTADEILCLQLDILDSVAGIASYSRDSSVNMRSFLSTVLDKTTSRKLLLSRASGGNVATYQVVFIGATALTNEPQISRQFVSFDSISAALRFYLAWSQHQQASECVCSTCLTEWGPGPGSGILRKYVFDLDVPSAEMYVFGLCQGVARCTQEVCA